MAFLVIRGENVRMLPVAEPASTSVDRLIELLPDLLEKGEAYFAEKKAAKEAEKSSRRGIKPTHPAKAYARVMDMLDSYKHRLRKAAAAFCAAAFFAWQRPGRAGRVRLSASAGQRRVRGFDRWADGTDAL